MDIDNLIKYLQDIKQQCGTRNLVYSDGQPVEDLEDFIELNDENIYFFNSKPYPHINNCKDEVNKYECQCVNCGEVIKDTRDGKQATPCCGCGKYMCVKCAYKIGVCYSCWLDSPYED